MIFVDSEVSFNLEKTIKFLIENYTRSGHNPKPVIMHSLRVGIYLLELGYEEVIVVSALLHDLLEDSEVTAEEIEQNFGKEVGRVIEAVSFNPQIVDSRENYREMFARVKEVGRKALIVKAADLYSNSFYYSLSKDQTKFDLLIEKAKYFIDLSQEVIGREKVWQDLDNQYLKLRNFKITTI